MTKIICNYCGKECGDKAPGVMTEKEAKEHPLVYMKIGVYRVGSGVDEREYDLHWPECTSKFYEYLDKFKKKK